MSASDATHRDSGFPEAQKDNLLQSLLDEINKISENDNVTLPKAFSIAAMKWLGEEDDGIEQVVDGAGDRGIDAYRMSAESIVLYQFKGRDTLDRDELLRPGSMEYIADVSRVISLLTSSGPNEASNSTLKKFLPRLNAYLKVREEAEALEQDNKLHNISQPYVSLKLVTLSKGLTRQATEELTKLKISNTSIIINGIKVLFDVELLDLDQLLSNRWRQTNTQWKDVTGRKSDSIRLHVIGHKIRDKSSTIFYTKAVDLIHAYDSFGYQIFEPNVRCQITSSRVNREIGKQVETEKGIEQFKDLNNGVTLVYSQYTERDKYVLLSKPGIVNGLQTVTTLSNKYRAMPDNLRARFEANCQILVRLYSKQNVNVPVLVKATNNQNPMEPRNLKSNDAEQVLLEQRFAEIGWFYERKDFAWEAFTADEVSWPTLKNVTRRNFQVQTGQSGRPAIRRVDNQNLAQAWLAFTGYSGEAVHRKREIFTNDKFYDHAFKSRPINHGSDFEYSFAEGGKAGRIASDAPLAEGLLIAWLCNYLSNALTPSAKKNRDISIERLKIGGKKKEDADAILNEDSRYLAGLIRSSATMLFAEVCGFILFRSSGDSFYKYAPKIMRETDMGAIFNNLSTEYVRQVVSVDHPLPKDGDLFSFYWLTFCYLTDSIAEDISWRNSFFQQSSRPRFLYSPDMRKRLRDYINNFDGRLRRSGVPLSWTSPLEKRDGLFNFTKKTLE